MKSVSSEFTDAITQADSPGVEVQLWLSNLSTGEDAVDATSYLDLSSVGNITEKIEKNLNEFIAGDVNLRVYNIGDYFLNDAGTGLFEKDYIIRVQLKFKFRGIADMITKFDGYLDRDLVKRKGENLIEFHCISWHKDLENWNAEKVADKTNNPFKNISGLKWEVGHTNHPTVEGGEEGVHELKHTYTDSNHYWQYDDGDLVEGNSGTVEVWNEYYQYVGTSNALQNKAQKFTFTIDDTLPTDSQTDTIVVFQEIGGGLVPAYWWENLPLDTLIGKLLDEIGKDEVSGSSGIIANREISVKNIDMSGGERVFSYFLECTLSGSSLMDNCRGVILVSHDEANEKITSIAAVGTKLLKIVLNYKNATIESCVEIGDVQQDPVIDDLEIQRLWHDPTEDKIYGIAGHSVDFLPSPSDECARLIFIANYTEVLQTKIVEYDAVNYIGCPWFQFALYYPDHDFYYVVQQSHGTDRNWQLYKYDSSENTTSQITYSPGGEFGDLWYSHSATSVGYSPSPYWDSLVFFAGGPNPDEDDRKFYWLYNFNHSTWYRLTSSWFVSAEGAQAPKYLSKSASFLWEDSEQYIDCIFEDYVFRFTEIMKPLSPEFAYHDIFYDDIIAHGWGIGDNLNHIISKSPSSLVFQKNESSMSYTTYSPPVPFKKVSGNFTDSQSWFFGFAHQMSGGNPIKLIPWIYMPTKLAMIEKADFTGMTIRNALDDLAAAFMCNYQRTGYDSAFFYYRKHARNEGSVYNLTTVQYYHPPKIALWKEQYDGVIVNGADDKQWASGQIEWGKRVLTINSRFLTDALGQTIADWMWDFFHKRRKLFYLDMKFLMQLELQDKISFKLPWDDSTTYYAFAYELEYQHDKHQIRGKMVEFEGVDINPITICRVGHELVTESLWGPNLYICEEDGERIQKRLKSDLSFISKIGSHGGGDDQFNDPKGITCDDEHIYIADQSNQRIQKRLKSTLEFVDKIGTYGSGDDQFNAPWDVACDDIYLYIADKTNYRIQKRLKSTLEFVAKIGTSGCLAVTCDDEYIYITDWSHHLQKRKKSDLSLVAEVGSYGGGDDQFDTPEGIACDETYLYVADTLNHRIKKHLKSDLSFVAEMGTQGSGDDQFNDPKGITCDDDYIYIADASNHRIQKRLKDLSFVDKIGTSGSGDDQFRSPHGIACRYDV